ncbi:hypothetical protein Y1Q_0022078 [Alligator mississippiensis]|uniref:Uncharacterized protein n=1 Tax=Alligator mississippiensis TaxID=8496 RepID=A0A151NUP6_ALLMI|nr:hypothetical protein Y1Q_0022078 [Alligator mississippiensis]
MGIFCRQYILPQIKHELFVIELWEENCHIPLGFFLKVYSERSLAMLFAYITNRDVSAMNRKDFKHQP